MKYVKLLVIDDLSYASRDKKELAAAVKAGFDISAIVTQQPSLPLPFKIKLIFVRQRETLSTMPRLKRYVRVIHNYADCIRMIRKVDADVLSCHDLRALELGYLGNCLRSKQRKFKLIYDAHEFEMGRNTDGRRSRFSSWFVCHAEGFLMKRCAINIMVNDSIAEETQRIHHLPEKPMVVRNMGPCWKLDQAEIKKQHDAFLKCFSGMKEPFLLMYHGGIVTGRGIEQVIELTALNPNVAAVILGNGPETYCRQLSEKAEELGAADRILFHKAVPHEELWKYVGAVDVGMVNIQPVCRSYYYALPNKFFENIQSLTPVICSDFPELRNITEKYGIGTVCAPEDVQALNQQVEYLRMNPEIYSAYRKNLRKAKEDLCWEKEENILLDGLRSLYKNETVRK